jgi:hypothetical protein
MADEERFSHVDIQDALHELLARCNYIRTVVERDIGTGEEGSWPSLCSLLPLAQVIILFGQETSDVITSLPGEGQDITCWKLSSDDACSFSSAYKMIVADEPTNIVPTKFLYILQQVWEDKTIQPRVKTFAWRLLRLALGTTNHLHRISENHLFFECNFARAVWLIRIGFGA